MTYRDNTKAIEVVDLDNYFFFHFANAYEENNQIVFG